MAQTHSDERLVTEKTGRLMLEMGIPGLMAQLINLLYNIVDRIYIGHIEGVGAEALTGVGVTAPLIMIISAFSALAGNGGAPLASIALGENDRPRAERILGNVATMLLVFSASLTLLFMVFRKPFLYMMGASDATYPYADQYIVVYLVGTVFVQLTLGLNPFITAQGQSRIAMFSVMIGAVINIILDPILIFLLGMGVRGAAVATVISQAASATWIVWFLTRPSSSLRIIPERMRPDGRILARIAALGISPFIMQTTESLIQIVVNNGLSFYGGDLYVGSMTILNSVTQLLTTPMSGFQNGVAPIMSYNYGARRPDRVKNVFWRLLALTTTISAAFAVFCMAFPQMLARIFTDSEELIALVGRVLPIYVGGRFLFGVQNGCQTTFMALGQARRSLTVALLRKVVILTPLAIILPAITKDVISIYWAEPIADALSAICCATMFFLFVRKYGFSPIEEKA